MGWILIIALYVGGKPAITTAEYSDRNACITAGVEFIKAWHASTQEVYFSCSSKTTKKD